MSRNTLCPILAPIPGVIAGRKAHTSKIGEGFGLATVSGRGGSADVRDNQAQGGTIVMA